MDDKKIEVTPKGVLVFSIILLLCGGLGYFMYYKSVSKRDHTIEEQENVIKAVKDGDIVSEDLRTTTSSDSLKVISRRRKDEELHKEIEEKQPIIINITNPTSEVSNSEVIKKPKEIHHYHETKVVEVTPKPKRTYGIQNNSGDYSYSSSEIDKTIVKENVNSKFTYRKAHVYSSQSLKVGTTVKIQLENSDVKNFLVKLENNRYYLSYGVLEVYDITKIKGIEKQSIIGNMELKNGRELYVK